MLHVGNVESTVIMLGNAKAEKGGIKVGMVVMGSARESVKEKVKTRERMQKGPVFWSERVER